MQGETLALDNERGFSAAGLIDPRGHDGCVHADEDRAPCQIAEEAAQDRNCEDDDDEPDRQHGEPRGLPSKGVVSATQIQRAHDERHRPDHGERAEHRHGRVGHHLSRIGPPMPNCNVFKTQDYDAAS
jgi:hypothetical protein